MTDFYLAAGATGLTILGIMGEAQKLEPKESVQIVRQIVGRANVAVDHTAVAVGLQMLDAGGDFADGVIAAEGAALGGEVFISFDRKAVKRLTAMGVPARDAREFQ